MKRLTLVCAILCVSALDARAQGNYTYDADAQVLVDNATNLKWQCGYALQFSYNNYFPLSYDYGKDTYPTDYVNGLPLLTPPIDPSGYPGNWRMPTTAELLDASRKGLLDAEFQVALMLNIAQPGDDWSWWPFWGVDPKATQRYAYYVVLGTGEKVKTLRSSSRLYVLLVR